MRLRHLLLPLLMGACAGQLPPPPASSSSVPEKQVVVGNTSSAISATSAPPRIQLRHRGTNLSGGEFGVAIPGVYGRDYLYPGPPEVDYFLARGMNHFRIPFRHERLQRRVKGPLDEEEWQRLLALVTYATSKGASVTIEPHNSARFGEALLLETEFGDFWGRVAIRLKTHAAADRIFLNLTNEPHDIPTERWVALANAALKEIRRVGFEGLVLTPGNAWTGAGHWASDWYGTPNSKALLAVVAPKSNSAFEAHLYLDKDASGAGDCLSEAIGVERLTVFVDWLRANKRLGFLGELGAPNTPTCQKAIARTLAYVEETAYDVLLGWAWWSAGVWTFATTYPLSIGPTKAGEPDKPQMRWLMEWLKPCSTNPRGS